MLFTISRIKSKRMYFFLQCCWLSAYCNCSVGKLYEQIECRYQCSCRWLWFSANVAINYDFLFAEIERIDVRSWQQDAKLNHCATVCSWKHKRCFWLDDWYKLISGFTRKNKLWGCGATRGWCSLQPKGLQPTPLYLTKSLKNFKPKYKRLNVFWTWPVSKWGRWGWTT